MSSLRIAVIANGAAPDSPGERAALRTCDGCVCCDRLPPVGAPPLLQVVGDMDTPHDFVPAHLLTDCHADQETNDLTKAMRWTLAHYPEAAIDYFAVTGKREDHTLANLALIAEWNRAARIFTNAGRFTVLVAGDHLFPARPGEPISFISFVSQRISVTGVVWPVENLDLTSLWRATLNRTRAERLDIRCEAPLFIYQPWSDL